MADDIYLLDSDVFVTAKNGNYILDYAISLFLGVYVIQSN